MTDDDLDRFAERASIAGDEVAGRALPDGVTVDAAWAMWDAMIERIRCAHCDGTGWTGQRRAPDADGMWEYACATCGGTGRTDPA